MNIISNNTFDWATFYIEFADKLLSYKNNRAELLTILKAAHEQAGLRCQFVDFTDIDPFTVFGAFNKGITNANRIALLKALAEKMDIKTTQPVNFDGIPVLMNMMAIVAWNTEDFSDVWDLFGSAISYADNPNENNRNSFIKWYNTVTKHKGISWNITMGLYWTRPYSYLNLDGTNRSFLLNGNETRSIGIENVSKLKRVPDAETYLKLIEVCQNSFSDNNTAFHSFPELSSAAWLATSSNSQEQDKKLSEANFIKWFEPLIEALKDLGGSATPEAARKQIVSNLNLPDEIINEIRGKNNVNKFENEVAFARNYLVNEGIIDNSTHGIWTLTEAGKNIVMTPEKASEIFRKWIDIFADRRKNVQNSELQERKTNEKRFWIYAPGENSRK